MKANTLYFAIFFIKRILHPYVHIIDPGYEGILDPEYAFVISIYIKKMLLIDIII